MMCAGGCSRKTSSRTTGCSATRLCASSTAARRRPTVQWSSAANSGPIPVLKQIDALVAACKMVETEKEATDSPGVEPAVR